MIALTTLGGHSVRVRLESALGSGTIVFGASHIAIVGGTDHPLTFSGKDSATLYAGATLVSDPVALALPALAHVAVSLYVPGEVAAPTSHTFALHTTTISKQANRTSPANRITGWPESTSSPPPTPEPS